MKFYSLPSRSAFQVESEGVRVLSFFPVQGPPIDQSELRSQASHNSVSSCAWLSAQARAKTDGNLRLAGTCTEPLRHLGAGLGCTARDVVKIDFHCSLIGSLELWTACRCRRGIFLQRPRVP